jgi:hypothetical protein
MITETRVRVVAIIWMFLSFILFFYVANNGYQPRPDLGKGIGILEVIAAGLFSVGFIANMAFVFFGRLKK